MVRGDLFSRVESPSCGYVRGETFSCDIGMIERLVKELEGHTTPGNLYYLPTNHRHATFFALTLPKLPSLHDRREHTNREFFRTISFAFSPYFLSPGTMTLLSDCELHLSIHARLHARNDTHLSSTILYYIIIK